MERNVNYLHTISAGEISIPTDIMPWLNTKSDLINVHAVVASFPDGTTISVASIINKHNKLAHIAKKTPKETSRKLNGMFYGEIKKICGNNGYHSPVLQCAPQVFYAKDDSGARAFFVEAKNPDKPKNRVFVLVAVCGHKNHEDQVTNILTNGVGEHR